MPNGLHHVTAIAGPAQRNLDFYRRVLGQRFVKKTVNFDDPGTYHFYFGDAAGRPGTIMTFFPWANAAPGRIGAGETQETVYRVPEGALPFWQKRLEAEGVSVGATETRFGEPVLPFRDPDGMGLALVGLSGIESEDAWGSPGIAPEHALRGFQGVRLLLGETTRTAAILQDVFGFRETGRERDVVRFTADGVALGNTIDLHAPGNAGRGRAGAGSVHHIAFRAADDAEQAGMAGKLRSGHGVHSTEQRDRDYFRSIYFREPGGVLFEIATDQPGFAVDEAPDSLGTALKLPKGLERHRAEIEKVLPPLDGAQG
ncbi:MAG: ring-cleaving dioxygenase [Mesorhizobium amorphae]|nr:MAG: ring-cleaving dioxygenase [Mesorhizobium amorphae]